MSTDEKRDEQSRAMGKERRAERERRFAERMEARRDANQQQLITPFQAALISSRTRVGMTLEEVSERSGLALEDVMAVETFKGFEDLRFSVVSKYVKAVGASLEFTNENQEVK